MRPLAGAKICTATGDPLEPEKEQPGSTPTATLDLTTPSASNEKLEERTSVQATNDGKQAGNDAAIKYPSGFKLASIILALIMGIFLASLDMTIVATAIPKITDEFHGLDKVSWYSAAFFMTNGGFQSSWGKAYRYFPLKTTFLTTIAVFELGSLICAFAPNSTAFIVGRAINGLGAAGIGTGAYTIIAFITEPSKRATYTGFVGMSFGVACVVGPLIGGVFADKVTWRWCFWINLPIGGLSALIILCFFRTPSGASPVAAPWREKLLQMDPVGVALVMGAIVAFMLSLQYGGQTAPWNSSVVIGLLAGFVLITAAFIVWEHFQGERAVIVPRLFKQRAICVSCLFAGIFVGSYYLVIYYIPIYFQSVGNASPTLSGVYNLPLIIATTISMITSGMLISATGHIAPLQIGGGVLAVISAGLLYTLDINTGIGKWVGYQLLGGVGWGLAFQIPIIVGQANADPEDISSVTAMVLFFQCIGASALVTAAQAAFVNRMVQMMPTTAPDVDPAKVIATGATLIRVAFPDDQVPGIVVAYMAGIKVAFGISIGGAGLGLVICLFSRWKRLHSDTVKDAVVAA
ncbi:major facilitator superfamily-domain-containing protein [Corynascus novoguineensis]|uniref:Major facilitator superfamily-domain-containing protein n=1 Tax=Corynascus novoguineensis TaxID=1126955 RepID=A0AAN7HCW9_9PEZI|nr:major facilitator superfamily-domain-containing protein [Corynascus novoguineensis]